SSPYTLLPHPVPPLFPYTTLFRSCHEQSSPLPSPGMLRRHYAPRAALECLAQGDADRVTELVRSGARVGWLPLALPPGPVPADRSEEHTSELQSLTNLVCRLLLEK